MADDDPGRDAPAESGRRSDDADLERARRALVEAEERYARLARAVTDYIYTVRVAAGRPVETRHGAGCVGVTGYTGEELETDGGLWSRMVPREHRARLVEQARRMLAEGEAPPVEHQIVRKDGAVRWVSNTPVPLRDAEGRFVGYDGLVRDITERKRAEALLEAERDLGLAIGEAASLEEALERCLATAIGVSGGDSGGVYLAEADGGLALAVHSGLSEGFVRATARFPADSANARIVGEGKPIYMTHATVGVALDEVRAAERLRALAVVPVRVRGEVVACLNVASHAHDDVPRWARVALEDVAGRIGSALVRARAEEAQRRVERERKALEERFHHAQKMEAVGRFAGGVAHDLNNLLTPILGYTEILASSFLRDDSRLGAIREVHEAGLRAKELVRQLLAFSRKQTLEFKPIDLNAAVAGFARLLRRTLREDVRLLLRLAPALPMIRGDLGQIEQVIMNLAVNAQDAMPDGGELAIETRPAPGAGASAGDFVALAIADTGHGMSAEVRAKIFEPFFTTKTAGKGTGLGLATVYGIVEQHGGAVEVASEVGVGTTFRLLFPALAEQPAAAAEPDAGAAAAARAPDETVMVVEDNDAVRGLAVDILREHGYTVLAAAGADECLRVLTSREGPLHLLLTDVVMPGMNGRALYDIVCAMSPATRVIYMSGYPQEVISERGVLEAHIDFLQKPFGVAALAAKVREVLDRG